MNIMDNYQAGINLGGWISQYSQYDIEHFKTFIKKKDIEQIASWGMDHVRLPLDYPVIEDEQVPFHYKESGFTYIDNCLAWCKEYGLNLILDLHRAPGYSFNSPESNTLFEDENQQYRLIKLWETIAKRYIDERDNLLFELLNEIVEPDSVRWNRLAKKLVEVIRNVDKDRFIIIGGNNYNSVSELKNLDVLEDDKIIYNFHFYEPMIFTHQKAPWVEMTRLFDKSQSYPGRCIGVREFCDKNSQFLWINDMENVAMDKALLEKYLTPAVDFMARTGKTLYCGEYGVIELAPMESRIEWQRDFVDLLRKYKIGRACWSYKQMDFGIVDCNGSVISEELVNVISKK